MSLNIGEKAPDFNLPSTDRKNISLSDYEGNKNILIAFFPIAFTPG